MPNEGLRALQGFLIIVASFVPLIGVTIIRVRHDRKPRNWATDWETYSATDHRLLLAQRWLFVGAVVFLNALVILPNVSWWQSQHRPPPVYRASATAEADKLRAAGLSDEAIAARLRVAGFPEREITDWLASRAK